MKRKADQFEHALRASSPGQPVEGSLASLVEMAHQVAELSGTPPAPPHRLLPGRQRFLAEAARLREARVRRQARPAWTFRLATALGVVAILLGVLFGTERAAAVSLPGEPLYGVKLAGEQLRLALTARPVARFALMQAMAQERMDEILALLETNRGVDVAVSGRAKLQLQQALVAATRLDDAAAPTALQRLAEAIQLREQAMRSAAGESPETPVQELLREMERVREEAYRGQGDPEGLRQRLRNGAPAEPTDRPGGTPTPGQSPTLTRQAPSPSPTPGASQTPHRTARPTESPIGRGTPAQTPAPSMTPRPTGEPNMTHTPVPSVTFQPPEPPHGSTTPGSTEAPTADPPRGTPAQTPGSGGGGGASKP